MLFDSPFQVLSVAAGLLLFPAAVLAQSTNYTALVVDSKQSAMVTPANVTLDLEGHTTPLQKIEPLAPDNTQVALLIDDGLRTSIGRQFTDIQGFLNSLKPGVEVMLGYMQNGRVLTVQPFTTNHADAAQKLRLPFGSPGLSASPYICLSDFAKSWPRESAEYGRPAAKPTRKTRIVLMITNGVDPYNGSVSPLNQNSPYVDNATTDAQRAGISVYSIYYADAGIRGGAASFSGQSYLNQIAEGTGGLALNQLRGPLPSITPFFDQFLGALDHTYVASFEAPEQKNLVSMRFKTKESGVKLRSAKQIQLTGGEPSRASLDVH